MVLEDSQGTLLGYGKKEHLGDFTRLYLFILSQISWGLGAAGNLRANMPPTHSFCKRETCPERRSAQHGTTQTTHMVVAKLGIRSQTQLIASFLLFPLRHTAVPTWNQVLAREKASVLFDQVLVLANGVFISIQQAISTRMHMEHYGGGQLLRSTLLSPGFYREVWQLNPFCISHFHGTEVGKLQPSGPKQHIVCFYQ